MRSSFSQYPPNMLANTYIGTIRTKLNQSRVIYEDAITTPAQNVLQAFKRLITVEIIKNV